MNNGYEIYLRKCNNHHVMIQFKHPNPYANFAITVAIKDMIEVDPAWILLIIKISENISYKFRIKLLQLAKTRRLKNV